MSISETVRICSMLYWLCVVTLVGADSKGLETAKSSHLRRLSGNSSFPFWQLGKADCGFLQENGSVFMIHNTSDMEAAAKLFCRRMVLTNCNNTDDIALLCPSTCPFLEMSEYSSWDSFGNRIPCGTACVPPQECGAYRPDLPFPNPETLRCESCPSDGWRGM